MKRLIALLTLALTLAAAPGLCADYAAMIMDQTGPKSRHASGPLAEKPLEPMDFLYEPDTVSVPQGATLVLNFFETASREEITGPALIKITKGRSEMVQGKPAQIKREALDYLPDKGKIDLASAQNFGNVAFRAMLGTKPKEPTKIQVLSLLNTVIRPGTAPSLRWLPVEDADSYTAVLRDGTKKELAASPLSEGPWFPDAALLAPGGQYTWTLTALKKGQPLASAEGSFGLLSEEENRTLRAEAKRLAARHSGESTEGRVALAMLYQGYGLKDDAAEILLTLRRQNPDNPAVKRQIGAINPALLKLP